MINTKYDLMVISRFGEEGEYKQGEREFLTLGFLSCVIKTQYLSFFE